MPSSGPAADPISIATEEGLRDGKLKARHAGDDIGRAQAVMAEWLAGYKRGLIDDAGGWRTDDAIAQGRLAGRPKGLEAGIDDGHQRGRAECAAAHAELSGRPTFRSVAPDPSHEAGPPPVFSACEPPSRIVINAGRNREVEIDPSKQDQMDTPFPYEVPASELPSDDWMRTRARQVGAGSGDNDVQRWTFAYRGAFKSAWDAEFQSRREAARNTDGPHFRDEGRAVGRAEGQRRAACSAYSLGHQEGWRQAFEETFAQAYREGWDECSALHDANPVIVLQSASLADAGSDGVIEPGEEVLLEVKLANAGLVPLEGPAARWRSAQGLPPKVGSAGANLAAQTASSERIPIGVADSGAPFGSSVIVELKPRGVDSDEVTAKIGRPVVVKSAPAELVAASGQPSVRVRARVESVAKRKTNRGLVLSAEGGENVPVGEVEPWAQREVEVLRPVDLGAALSGGTIKGQVELEDSTGLTWMTQAWSASADMSQAVKIASGLSDATAAAPILRQRLEKELAQSLADPKLYKKLEEGSELLQFSAALRAVSGPPRDALERGVSAPLLARSEDKDLPKPVRKALRNALSAK